MTNVLLARPVVYTDQLDEIPELLEAMRSPERPDVLVLDMPRGMMAPRRVWYTQDIASALRGLGGEVEYRLLRDKGKDRTLLLARFDGQPLRWGYDLFGTIQLNH